MRALFRMLPLLAIALVGLLNRGGLKKHFDVIGRVQVAATNGGQLQAIADAVAREAAGEGRLPVENFPQFLRENLRTRAGGEKRDVAKDAWGIEYKLAVREDGFEVQSAGPDKAWRTADDLKLFYALTGPGDAALLAEARARNAGRAGQTPATNAGAGATGTPVSTRRALIPLPPQAPEVTRQKVLEFQMRRAAEGSPQAQFDLAIRYFEGDGVERDLAKGREWLEKSAQGGHEAAGKKLQAMPLKPKAE